MAVSAQRAKGKPRHDVVEPGLPKGPIGYKYIDFRDNWDFAGMLFYGTLAVGKSRALVDSIYRSAIEFPGANLLLARGTLSELRRSTVPYLEARLGAVIDSENRHESVYRLPVQIDPLSGSEVQTKIFCMGMDRPDIEDVMRSTEWFRIFLEEANEISSEAQDLCILRCRQFCFHQSLTVRHYVMDRSRLWGVSADEVYAILREAKETPISQFDLGLDDPMPGSNGIKCVANPQYDHLWQRYVAVPYPDGPITPEWVDKHVGVREFYRTPEDREDVEYDLVPGDHVVDFDDVRGYVRSRSGNEITLMDGRKCKNEELDLILQLNTIYGFSRENESKNYANVRNALLTVNVNLRKRVWRGVDDVRRGLVFPNFINQYVDDGGHILPYPKEQGLPKNLRGVAGIDQGGGHATAASFSLITKQSHTAVVFGEYVKSGVAASTTAYELLGIPPVDMQMRWAGDPSMWAKEYSTDVEMSKARRYMEAGINLEKGHKGDQAFDSAVELFEFVYNYLQGRKMPRLFIFDNCPQHIYMLSNLTWEDVRHSRHKWIVDLGDAFKIMCGLIEKAGDGEVVMPQAKPAVASDWELDANAEPYEGTLADYLEPAGAASDSPYLPSAGLRRRDFDL